MALHPDFPTDPYVVLDPAIRWYPGDEMLARWAMRCCCRRLSTRCGRA